MKPKSIPYPVSSGCFSVLGFGDFLRSTFFIFVRRVLKNFPRSYKQQFTGSSGLSCVSRASPWSILICAAVCIGHRGSLHLACTCESSRDATRIAQHSVAKGSKGQRVAHREEVSDELHPAVPTSIHDDVRSMANSTPRSHRERPKAALRHLRS